MARVDVVPRELLGIPACSLCMLVRSLAQEEAEQRRGVGVPEAAVPEVVVWIRWIVREVIESMGDLADQEELPGVAVVRIGPIRALMLPHRIEGKALWQIVRKA